MFPLPRHDLPPTCLKIDFNQPIYLGLLENRNTDISSIFPAQFPLEMERPFNENSQFSARNIPLISIDFAQKPEVESPYYFL